MTGFYSVSVSPDLDEWLKKLKQQTGVDHSRRFRAGLNLLRAEMKKRGDWLAKGEADVDVKDNGDDYR